MTDLENALRTSLHALARDAGAPAGRPTAQEVIARSRRRQRSAWSAAAAAVLVGAVGAAVVDLPASDRAPVVAAEESTTEIAPAVPSGSPSPTGTVAPPAGTAASCAQEYSPSAVARRAFAFDGTVTGIGPALSNRPGGELELSAVTFRVHSWFRGGSGDTVTVDLAAPSAAPARGQVPASSTDGGMPPYDLGTRLLVSGEPRWGGAPLDAAIAGSCGFTRPYDPATAASWADATG